MIGPHRKILLRFGGYYHYAQRTKTPVTTVQKWWNSGWIPSRRMREVLDAGQNLRDPLTWDDFLPPPTE